MATETKVYYFGCIEQSGHYLFTTNRRYSTIDMEGATPWGFGIDGVLQPQDDKQTEGRARLHHKDGWTALAFWDCSIDRRPQSNSTFLAEGIYTFDEMLKMARERFPNVMERLKFPIVLVA